MYILSVQLEHAMVSPPIQYTLFCTLYYMGGSQMRFLDGLPRIFARSCTHIQYICTKYITTRYITQSKAQCFSCCLLQPHPAALPSGLNISQFGPYSNTARQRPASMHPPAWTATTTEDNSCIVVVARSTIFKLDASRSFALCIEAYKQQITQLGTQYSVKCSTRKHTWYQTQY